MQRHQEKRRGCTAWATEGGLCYFHANPDKAVELGRSGGLRRQHTFEQLKEQIAPPESAADVRRLLAETMAEVKLVPEDFAAAVCPNSRPTHATVIAMVAAGPTIHEIALLVFICALYSVRFRLLVLAGRA